MIVDKKDKGRVVSGNSANTSNEKPKIDKAYRRMDLSTMPENGLTEIYNAIKEILKGTKWSFDDTKENNECIFRTVKMGTGQYYHVVSGKENTEDEIAYPAAFISFIDIRWGNAQYTMTDGTAELRIQIVMDTLNNHDDDIDTEVFYVAQRVIDDIGDKRYKYPSLRKQCKLRYLDTATSYHSGLQSAWLTFDVRFTQSNTAITRKLTQKYIVAAPFTNHKDQKNPELQNPDKHTDDMHEVGYDDRSKFADVGDNGK